MKTLCQPADGICSQCGEPLTTIQARTCPAGPNGDKAKTPKAPCPHLGEPTGSVALIKCVTCCGNVRKKYDVHSCAVFGECLPKQKASAVDTGGKEWHGCKGCARPSGRCG